jgi:hypothetical protein
MFDFEAKGAEEASWTDLNKVRDEMPATDEAGTADGIAGLAEET